MEKPNRKWLRDWIRLERLVPLATIGVAGFALILVRLGILTLSIPEGLIVALLGLLAFDALGERMGILKRMQDSLDLMNKAEESGPRLILESDLLHKVPFEKYTEKAKEVFIAGGSMHGLFTAQPKVIEQWLSQTKRAKLLLVLVDPESVRTGKVSVQDLHISQNAKEYAQHIDFSLGKIKNLQNSFPGKVEYRLTDQPPSVTVLMVDRSKARVSLNLYLISPDRRPVFEISRLRYPNWLFELFEQKYRVQLWQKPKKPSA